MEESLKIKLKELLDCGHKFVKTSEELCETKIKKFYKCEKCGLIAKNILLKDEITYTKFDFCINEKFLK